VASASAPGSVPSLGLFEIWSSSHWTSGSLPKAGGNNPAGLHPSFRTLSRPADVSGFARDLFITDPRVSSGFEAAVRAEEDPQNHDAPSRSPWWQSLLVMGGLRSNHYAGDGRGPARYVSLARSAAGRPWISWGRECGARGWWVLRHLELHVRHRERQHVAPPYWFAMARLVCVCMPRGRIHPV